MANFGTKLKAFLKANGRLLLFMSIFAIINCAFFAIACKGNNTEIHSKRFILSVCIMAIVNIALCCVVFFAKQKSWPIEKVFLIVGSTLGIFYLLAIPIGRVPDEPAHIFRVYSIAQGGILNETQEEVNGNLLPENVASFSNSYNENAYDLILQNFSEPASEDQVFRKTIGSNPIDYLPQIIGMTIGRILHLPMLAIFYLARICTLATCIAIIYFCLKYIPILKKSLFFISCLPLSMQTFIAISYDSMILCSAIAILTFVLYTIYHRDFRLKTPHYCLLVLLSILLIATKPVYFPICLLLFFIPDSCLGGKKKKLISISAVLAITFCLFAIWSAFSVVTQPGNGADTGGQISYILSNPARFVVILIYNILDLPITYLLRFGALEWLDVHISDFYTIGVFLFFVALCIDERLTTTKSKISKPFHFAVLAAAIFTTIFTFVALYIQWTQVGATVIEGVQTRYLLPIFLTVPLLCISTKSTRTTSRNKELIPQAYLYSSIIFLNLNAISILLCTHI